MTNRRYDTRPLDNNLKPELSAMSQQNAETAHEKFAGYVDPKESEANRTLVEQTHPADYLNPQPEPSYNLVIIGGRRKHENPDGPSCLGESREPRGEFTQGEVPIDRLLRLGPDPLKRFERFPRCCQG